MNSLPFDARSQKWDFWQDCNITEDNKRFSKILLGFNRKKYNAKIVSCKTIRDSNKFAFSSRNNLLNKTELAKARKISKTIFSLKKKLTKSKNVKNLLIKKKKEIINLLNVKVDYLELRNILNLKNSKNTRNSRLFIAYFINKVRLIDNF